MKAIYSPTYWIAAAAIACGIFIATVPAAAQQTAGKEQSFASPEEAIAALKEAAQARDKAALDKIFGPGIKLLRTGDAVEDANHRAHFAQALAEGCQPTKEGDGKIVLEIGTNNWPFPIPLVKAGSEWRFDTEAGEEEIIDRHIGRDELNAIGVCNAYVQAQRQYNSLNPEQSSEPRFALKFKSSPGKKDGLYWPEGGSPFGPLVAEAYAEGYTHLKSNNGPHPFHGYCFRILTMQGPDAPGGKMNYMHHGHLVRGFALVAYPVAWDKGGIMTFIVNQDGHVYQRNLGEKTYEIASSMKEYNPDGNWTIVQEQGVLEK
jgi:hypothetical protein